MDKTTTYARKLLELASSGAAAELAAQLKAHPVSAEVLAAVVDLAGQRSRSLQQQLAAKSKNLNARLWVADQWKGQGLYAKSKVAFARAVAPLVKERFGVVVRPAWIASNWLPRLYGQDYTQATLADPSAERAVAWTGLPQFKKSAKVRIKRR